MAEFSNLPDAINEAYRLNDNLGWNLTFEELMEKIDIG